MGHHYSLNSNYTNQTPHTTSLALKSFLLEVADSFLHRASKYRLAHHVAFLLLEESNMFLAAISSAIFEA